MKIAIIFPWIVIAAHVTRQTWLAYRSRVPSHEDSHMTPEWMTHRAYQEGKLR